MISGQFSVIILRLTAYLSLSISVRTVGTGTSPNALRSFLLLAHRVLDRQVRGSANRVRGLGKMRKESLYVTTAFTLIPSP